MKSENTMGRVETIKGLSVLLDTFEAHSEKILLIAGTGTEFDYYKEHVLKRNINNIQFLGFLEKDALLSYIKNAKALIVASQWYETFGMIIVEAFSNHKSVITGDIGNIGNIVTDGYNGVKFQYNSSEDLWNAIVRFEALDSSILEKNAYKTFQEKYTPKVNYEILKNIYDQACL